MAIEDARLLASIQATKLMATAMFSAMGKNIPRDEWITAMRTTTLDGIDRGDNRMLRLDLVPPHLHDAYKLALREEVTGHMVP